MVTQRKPKASKYLTTPTRPVQVDRDRSVAGLLEKMEGTGFGGRQLAEAHRIWLDMLGDNTTITVAASGALIPAGMRRLLAYVIKNRFVDVVSRFTRNPGPLPFSGPPDHDRRRVGIGPD
jgi:deoxyhypusine synthase